MAQVRPRLLAGCTGRARGRDPDGVGPRVDSDRRGSVPLYDFVIFPGTRSTPPARVRPDRGLSQPGRQPRLPLREQLLLGGAARGAMLRRTRLWRDRASRSRRSSGSSTARTTTAASRGRSSCAPLRPRRGCGPGPGSPTVGLRPETRRLRDRDRHATLVHARHDPPRGHPRPLRPGTDGPDDLLRGGQGAKVFAGGAIDFGGTAMLPVGGACSRTSGLVSPSRDDPRARAC